MTINHLRNITKARGHIARAQQELRQVIVVAFNDREGFTVEDIAKAAGLTRERVYQIVKEQAGRG